MVERDGSMETRARALAKEAIISGHSWVQRLGSLPSDPSRRERRMREVSTIAAYRDRWHIASEHILGNEPPD